MDKVLTLIISAAVLTATGIILMATSGGQIGQFSQTAEQTKTSQLCNIQVEQYCNVNMKASELDSRCLNQVQNQCSQKQVDQAVAQQANIPVN